MTRYVAIPHQLPAQIWYSTDEELGPDDTYVAGDHDLHAILELNDALEWTGHQGPRVRALAEQETMDRLNRYA